MIKLKILTRLPKYENLYVIGLTLSSADKTLFVSKQLELILTLLSIQLILHNKTNR
jgi:hypothetical protein